MARTGRPKIIIDKNTFEKLCALQCTEQEIAAWFKCSIETVNSWCKSTYGLTFLDTYKTFASTGKIALRRYQFHLAKKNPGMAIFLGKNWLGQTDHVEAEVVHEVEDLSALADLLKD